MKISGLLRWGLIGAVLALALRLTRRGMSLAGKVVLITGGSRGLGLALAREFARRGARIAIVARDKAELDRAKEDLLQRGAEVWTGICDLRDREQISAAIREVVSYFGGLDVLVNNAGLMTVGPVESMTDDDFDKALSVHFWAPYYAMNAAIPHLKGRDGRIVNIVSIGGKVALPHMAPYTASKFALAGLSQAFRAELIKDGIKVTTVFPGLMRTGSHLNALFKGKNEAEYRWFSLGVASPASSISATRAARQIVRAAQLGQPQLIVSFQARLLALAAAIFPNLTGRALSAVNRSLPAMPEQDHEMRTGWESQSGGIYSRLMHFADKAGESLNERRGHTSAASERHDG
ncbi:MAG: SDR family NAD(P)-dependent oxidoreductase [Chthoniobacteraceae bacterium]